MTSQIQHVAVLRSLKVLNSVFFVLCLIDSYFPSNLEILVQFPDDLIYSQEVSKLEVKSRRKTAG